MPSKSAWIGLIVGGIGVAAAVIASACIGIGYDKYGAVPSMDSDWHNSTCLVSDYTKQYTKNAYRAVFSVSYNDSLGNWVSGKAAIHRAYDVGYTTGSNGADGDISSYPIGGVFSCFLNPSGSNFGEVSPSTERLSAFSMIDFSKEDLNSIKITFNALKISGIVFFVVLGICLGVVFFIFAAIRENREWITGGCISVGNYSSERSSAVTLSSLSDENHCKYEGICRFAGTAEHDGLCSLHWKEKQEGPLL